MFRIVCSLSGFATAVLAASCWRNTTCSGPAEASFPGPWESYMYSPESRFIHPRSILSFPSGKLDSDYEDDTKVVLDGSSSTIVFDFGVEVGGVITFDYKLNGADTATFGLAFTEAKDYIGPKSDSSRADTGGKSGDGPLLVNATSNDDKYLLPTENLRGGFRHLTIFLDSSDDNVALEITNITLELSFQPTWSNLRAYRGYFQSDDEALNRIWYAGAYTVQTNSVPGNTGRNSMNANESGWRNDAFITNGDTVLLDGAKRDRWVWIGDMGVAVPSAFVSTGELDSTKYALMAIYDNQRSDGVFPKAGPPYVRWDSDSYHLWAMIGTYNYFLYSGDVDWIEEHWPKYEAAVNYTLTLLNSAGIVSVKGNRDWGRLTFSSEQASASMLVYRALTTGAYMASWLPNPPSTNLSDVYLTEAETLRRAIIEEFWDDDVGAFTDSPRNASLHPQDANSMALAYGVLEPVSEKADRVSDYLASTWTPIGPSSPELPGNVSPFISSIEVEAHFQVGKPGRALELIRSLWGWYLDNENGTQSTTPEGYLVDGSWGYRYNNEYNNGPSYTSHAHSWSSGPTSTLTEYMVGLRVTSPAGKEWELKPASFDELTSFQAGFTTSLGKFSAKIHVEGCEVTVQWDTPENTAGTVALPGKEPMRVQGGKHSTKVLASNSCRRVSSG